MLAKDGVFKIDDVTTQKELTAILKSSKKVIEPVVK